LDVCIQHYTSHFQKVVSTGNSNAVAPGGELLDPMIVENHHADITNAVHRHTPTLVDQLFNGAKAVPFD